MKKTGQLLKSAREAKGISLQEVSLHLKISTRTLKSLEDGEMNQLPAKTFLRGFVQSYSQFLKVNHNEIMAVFQEEMGTTHPGMVTTQIATPPDNYALKQGEPSSTGSEKTIESASTSSTSTTTTTQVSSSPSSSDAAVKPSKKIVEPTAPALSVDPKTWANSIKVGTAVFILLMILIIYFVKKTVDKYEKEGQLPTEQIEISTDNSADATTPTNSVEGATLTSPEPSPNPEALITDNTNTEAIDNLNLSTKPSPDPSPMASSNPLLAQIQTPTPTPTLLPSETTEVLTTQEVIIEALDRVNVEFQIDDGSKETLLLQAERIHTFKARKKIKLTFSDGGSINLIYNGKDLGVPGNLGQSYTASFPK